MKLTFDLRWNAVALSLSLVILTSCGGKTAPDLLASARKSLEKSDVQAAIVDVKSALQLDPSSPDAHMLFGKALAMSGNPVDAELELRKVLASGKALGPEYQVVLAQSLLDQGKFPKVIEEFSRTDLPDAAADAALKVMVATSLAQGKNLVGADALLAQVLVKSPKLAAARLLQARIVAVNGDVPGALAKADGLTKELPDSPQAWALLGNLRLMNQDAAGAVPAFKKTVTLAPKDPAAHAMLITIALDSKDLGEADRLSAAMSVALPGHPQTLFAKARVAVARQDFAAARPILQQLVQAYPNSVPVLQLAGIVEVQSGALAQGDAMFTKVIQLAPENDVARVLLARSSLQAGFPDRAMSALKPLLDQRDPHPDALTVAAESQLMLGHPDEAEALFRRVVKARPDQTVAQTALALMDVSRGKLSEGLTRLAQISKSSQDTAADMALIAVHQRRGDLAKALEAIDGLELKDAKSAIPGVLRGQALLVAGKSEQAIQALDAALKKQPTFPAAMDLLVAAELQQRKFEKAVQRAEEATKANPGNGQALLMLARVREEAGADRATVQKLVADAVGADPSSADARAYQIDRLLKSRSYKEAVSAAQEARTAMPDSAPVTELLGRALLESGDASQALTVFNKLAQLVPHSPKPYLLMAEAYTQATDNAGAVSSLRRALTMSPDSVEANRALIRLALRAKKPDEALAYAKAYQKRQPGSATGFLLESEVHSAQLHWNEAVAATRQALGKTESESAASRLVAVLTSADRAEDGARFAASWLKEHPKDARFVKNLADMALASGDLPTAEQRFTELNRLEPNNPAILNNIAWLMVQQKKGGARYYSEKAVQLGPYSANFLDTHAQVLVAEGQHAAAIEAGRRAITLDPGNQALRLSIANVLLRAGDASGAQKEIEGVEAAAVGNPALLAEVKKARAQVRP